MPLRAAAFEIPRKFAVFLRNKGALLNGVQKVVSSNLTAPTIFAKEFDRLLTFLKDSCRMRA